MTPITNAVYGSMSLRNRAVTTSVFWGARQRETLREHQSRLEMSQLLLPQQPTSSTASAPRIYECITLSDDEEDKPEPEGLMEVIVKEEDVPKAPEVQEDQERISSSPEDPPDVRNTPDPSEIRESFESPTDDTPDECSVSSIIPDDPKISEDPVMEEAEVQSTSVDRGETPEDPKASDQPSETSEPQKQKDQNQNVQETRTPTPDEPMDDEPPVLEIQIPKDSRESGSFSAIPEAEAHLISGPSSSTSSAVEKNEPNEPSEPTTKKPRAKRQQKPKGAEPVRKSRRGAAAEVTNVQEVAEELLGNYVETRKVQARNVIFPIGVNRVPFRFDKATILSDPGLQKVKNNLEIDMKAPEDKKKVEEPDESETKTVNKKVYMEANRSQIFVGPMYQADEVEMATEPDEQPEREELLWTPPPEEMFFDYEALRNQYWKAIWRQYEGHIPMEVTLQHLMKNNYIMSDSLKTIDQTLHQLPQAFKPICQAQAACFDDTDRQASQGARIPRRNLQEAAMKNYHIGEVQMFYYRWRKYYKNQSAFFSCNCYEPLCEDLVFEPRWACSNCTAHLRPQPASTSRTKLCLICQTHRKFSVAYGGPPLPDMKNLVLHDFELQKVRDFERFQKESEKILTREQVETMLEKESEERWKRLEMTEEEEVMYNEKGLKFPRKSTKAFTPEELKKRGRLLAAQLKPFVLPLFSKCNCLLNKFHEKDAERRKRKLEAMNEGETKKLKRSIQNGITKFGDDMKLVSLISGAHLPELKQFVLDNVSLPGYDKLLNLTCFERMEFPISNLPPTRPYDTTPQIAEFSSDVTLYVEPSPEEKWRIAEEDAREKAKEKAKEANKKAREEKEQAREQEQKARKFAQEEARRLAREEAARRKAAEPPKKKARYSK